MICPCYNNNDMVKWFEMLWTVFAGIALQFIVQPDLYPSEGTGTSYLGQSRDVTESTMIDSLSAIITKVSRPRRTRFGKGGINCGLIHGVDLASYGPSGKLVRRQSPGLQIIISLLIFLPTNFDTGLDASSEVSG